MTIDWKTFRDSSYREIDHCYRMQELGARTFVKFNWINVAAVGIIVLQEFNSREMLNTSTFAFMETQAGGKFRFLLLRTVVPHNCVTSRSTREGCAKLF